MPPAPSLAAAANIRSSASAASARMVAFAENGTLAVTRSGGRKLSGFSGRNLSATTQMLIGSSIDSAALSNTVGVGSGVGDSSGATAAALVGRTSAGSTGGGTGFSTTITAATTEARATVVTAPISQGRQR